MSWNDSGTGVKPSGDSRAKVGAIAAAIIVVFVIGFAVIVHVANSHSHKAAVAATTTTTTGVAASGDTSPTTASSGSDDTTSATAPIASSSPQGKVYGPLQLATAFPQSDSNLSAADFTTATNMAVAFVTADTTGTGADKFAAYYSNGYVNRPWIKNLNIQWSFATSPIEGVTKATVWFTGTSLVSGQPLTQVTQDIYLDEDKGFAPIQRTQLPAHQIYVDVTCCTSIVQ